MKDLIDKLEGLLNLGSYPEDKRREIIQLLKQLKQYDTLVTKYQEVSAEISRQIGKVDDLIKQVEHG